jgi:hypothetical protein
MSTKTTNKKSSRQSNPIAVALASNDNDSLRALIAAIKDGSVGLHYELAGQKEAAIARLTYELNLREAKATYSEAIRNLSGEQARRAIVLGESLEEAYRIVRNGYTFAIPEQMDAATQLSIEMGLKYGVCQRDTRTVLSWGKAIGNDKVIVAPKNQVPAQEAFAALAADILAGIQPALISPLKKVQTLETSETVELNTPAQRRGRKPAGKQVNPAGLTAEESQAIEKMMNYGLLAIGSPPWATQSW